MFAEGGWAPTVADGGFTHEYSAPGAGPPPWFVYEFMAEDAYAVATNERRLPMVLLTPRAAGGGDVHTAAATMPG